jgi:hypothetical protein
MPRPHCLRGRRQCGLATNLLTQSLETIMHSRDLTQSVLAIGMAVLALNAGAQTTVGNAPGSAAVTSTGQAPTSAAHKHHKHHKRDMNHKHHKHHHDVSHHDSSRSSGRTAGAMGASDREPAYRAALRQCVEGPQARRDGCIDDAIARFGHL